MSRSTPRKPQTNPLSDAVQLGGLSVDQFLAHHWQRKPLLVRQALPAIKPPLSAEALIGLASDDAVQSRRVSAFNGRWQLAHGPFEPGELPPLSRKRWTLLVQGVNLHNDAAHALMSRFRFIPDARLDDLMISLASDQGGVGPHLDSYDVFLVQIWGQRLWKIAPPGNDAFRPDLPLKILERFEPAEQWLLQPGDMLYLPPGWAHDGIAQGACMTASIGFRAPSRIEFLREFLAQSADDPGGPDPRFSDPGRARARRPAGLPDDLAAQLTGWAQEWRPSRTQIADFIGRYLTEPAATVFFDEGPRQSPQRFSAEARKHGLCLDRKTRMLHRGGRLFINGESLDALRGSRAKWLITLADKRALDAVETSYALGDTLVAQVLHEWLGAGWLRLAKSRSS